jgi:hypothetical protein
VYEDSLPKCEVLLWIETRRVNRILDVIYAFGYCVGELNAQ